MTRIFTILLLIMILLPTVTAAEHIKASFIRDGNVWVYIGDKEKQITDSGKVIGVQSGHMMERGFYTKIKLHPCVQACRNKVRFGHMNRKQEKQREFIMMDIHLSGFLIKM